MPEGDERSGAGGSPAEVYEGLRSMVLGQAGGQLTPTPEHPDVSGVVADISRPDGCVTVVALTDNTTSLYTSAGGGVIGAGEHQQVAEVTQRLLAVVQAHIGLFGQRDDKALPPPGQARLHVLSPAGDRHRDVPEDAFWGRANHELMPVIAALQDVITAMRQASPPQP
jgi:hypothetical protein